MATFKNFSFYATDSRWARSKISQIFRKFGLLATQNFRKLQIFKIWKFWPTPNLALGLSSALGWCCSAQQWRGWFVVILDNFYHQKRLKMVKNCRSRAKNWPFDQNDQFWSLLARPIWVVPKSKKKNENIYFFHLWSINQRSTKRKVENQLFNFRKFLGDQAKNFRKFFKNFRKFSIFGKGQKIEMGRKFGYAIILNGKLHSRICDSSQSFGHDPSEGEDRESYPKMLKWVRTLIRDCS